MSKVSIVLLIGSIVGVVWGIASGAAIAARLIALSPSSIKLKPKPASRNRPIDT
jgi:hypothetical protein